MTQFLSRLVVSKVEGSRLWITDEVFIVESELVGVLEIPAGFIFDGNSLPRAFWWASLPTDFLESGCVHDFLYRYSDDRKLADQVYREFLEYQQAGKVRRNVRYVLLRLFGGAAFNKHKTDAAR